MKGICAYSELSDSERTLFLFLDLTFISLAKQRIGSHDAGRILKSCWLVNSNIESIVEWVKPSFALGG